MVNKSPLVYLVNTCVTGDDEMQLNIPGSMIRKSKYSLSSGCQGNPKKGQNAKLEDLGSEET